MREELKKSYGLKRKYHAEFMRFGAKDGARNPSMLIKNVVDKYGEVVADHLWLQNVSGAVDMKFKSGDFVEFTALVHTYKKTDYGLTLISEVKRL